MATKPAKHQFAYLNARSELRTVQVMRKSVRDLCGANGSGHTYRPLLNPPPKCTHVCTTCGHVQIVGKPAAKVS